MLEQTKNDNNRTEIGKKNKILVVGTSWDQFGGSFLGDSNYWTYELCANVEGALFKIVDSNYNALLIEQEFFQGFYERSQYSQERSILENLPAGLALVDNDQHILWCNRQFREWSNLEEDLIGKRFFVPLGRPEMRGPDYCPFSKTRLTGKSSSTVLVQKESGRYLQMNTAPVLNEYGKPVNFVVELHDVTEQTIREIKWSRLREAGKELADLSKEDVLSRSPQERVNILRAKIGNFAQEILNFASIEIRTISEKVPNLLEPLLAIGMTEEAKKRTLYVNQEGNGITGWVAFHARSYKMDDSREDPFFIEGIPGARSSITVPLLYRSKVIGTFNVESQKTKAFDDNDLRLLESFAKDVAQAIHTLDLFSFEQKDSAYRSIEKVYGMAVGPINQILNETARLQMSELGKHEELFSTLGRIRQLTRDVQAAFQGFVAKIAVDLPQEISATDCSKYTMLRNKRILMVDADESIGRELSRMLFYYGCTVETASTGESALKMLETTKYDIFMSDIKLPDMSAFLFFKRVRCAYCKQHNRKPNDFACEPPTEDPRCPKDEVPFIPFIYMRAFGYDSGHVTIRAAEAGLPKPIFKPFILTQLLDILKLVITKSYRENKPDNK
ncbi:MAG: GAF domain-containing protein [Planctomycetaceae bacterium]|jgi:PAS domain S-box-containing protein|nr:GAF domain-containing protein [Planctomycetaceae bacterium]